jgi:hypothetical protein
MPPRLKSDVIPLAMSLKRSSSLYRIADPAEFGYALLSSNCSDRRQSLG